MNTKEVPQLINPPVTPAAPVPGGSSAKRIAANRLNSQLSTGPRGEEGRAVASQNATRHGFFSAKALIPGESPQEFEAFRQYQLSQLQVRGEVENLIGEQFVITSWRLQRLERIEAETFTRYGLSSNGEVMGSGFAMQGDNFLSTLGRYEASLRRQYFRCLDTLQALRKGPLFDHLPPPVPDVQAAPVVGPAPGQVQLRPVAVPSGLALDEPGAAPSAGNLALVDGAPDPSTEGEGRAMIMPRPPTVPELSRLPENEDMQFIDFPSNCRFGFLPSWPHQCGGRNVENYETNPPRRRSGLPATTVEGPGPRYGPDHGLLERAGRRFGRAGGWVAFEEGSRDTFRKKPFDCRRLSFRPAPA